MNYKLGKRYKISTETQEFEGMVVIIDKDSIILKPSDGNLIEFKNCNIVNVEVV